MGGQDKITTTHVFLIIAILAHGLASFVWIDSRFDKIERTQDAIEAKFQSQWTYTDEIKTWQNVSDKNPEIEIPQIVKTTQNEK